MPLMHRERGFSLAEIMVALLILTIVITVSFTAFLQRNKRLQQASEIILAYQALANEAEYQRRVPFNELAPRTTFLSDTAILAPMKPYGTAIRIDETRPGVRNVTMTVRWGSGKREARLALVRVDTGGSNLW
jgi:prepilin-type N-terminal cleavage/methylation domain-containing protein